MRLMSGVLTFILLAFVFTQAGEIKLGAPAPDFTLKDAEGKAHQLSDYRGKIVVLEWVNYGCPFVKKFYNSGTMQALQKKYTEKGVVWLSICSSAPGKQGHYAPEKIRELKKEKGAFYTAYLIDEEGTVGRLYGAKTTPHMFIIDPDGNLVYAGAIDDQPSSKQSSLKNARNYLSETLDKMLQNQPVKPFMTKPYGCSVKYKK
ncbi:thioredoxin family protein [Caldithrix abyssi]